MAFTTSGSPFNNILNIAGNWWKGAPAPVYFDMYENNIEFDDAVTDYSEMYMDEPDFFGEELGSELDDEFLVEKAIYQVEQPDAMLTPYGPALTSEAVEATVAEYPGIMALATTPGGVSNPDDFFDGWDEYFSEADTFSAEASDEIDQIMEAVSNTAVAEGQIGSEPSILSQIGEQLGDAASNIGDVFADPVELAKGVAGNIADMFNNALEPELEPTLYAGDPMAAGAASPDDEDTGQGFMGNIADMLTASGEATIDNIAALPGGGQLMAGMKLDKLLDPEIDGSVLTPYEILEQLAGGYVQEDGTIAQPQDSETVSQWMSTGTWDDRVSEIGLDPDELRQQIEDTFRISPAQHPDITFGADTFTDEDLADTIADTTAATTTSTSGPSLEDVKESGRYGYDDDGLESQWGEDLRKVFYKRIYAEPGVGRSDVVSELPNVFNQTRAMFLALHGGEMLESIKKKTTDDPAMRASLEDQYQEFLDDYLANPAQVLADPALRTRILNISDILRRGEEEPEFRVWSTEDENQYTWMDALFGEGQGTNRNALIDINLTGGGMGEYSKALQQSAARAMNYYRNIGWTEAQIFKYMTGAGRPTKATTTQAVPEGYFEDPGGETDFFPAN